MRKNDAVKGQGGNPFGPVVVAFLGSGQQWVQHFNRRFEHLNEFHDTLVRAAQCTGVAIGIGIVLCVVFQFTDVHFTHQSRDVLVVLIARFCFRDGNLFKYGWPDFDHAEFADVTAKIMQAFSRPRRHDGAEVTTRNVIFLFQNLRVFLRVEQT